MSLHNLIEYSNNYSKTSQILWQYYTDEPVFTEAGAPVYFRGNSAYFKPKITDAIENG